MIEAERLIRIVDIGKIHFILTGQQKRQGFDDLAFGIINLVL
jgi:hypothetical protein